MVEGDGDGVEAGSWRVPGMGVGMGCDTVILGQEMVMGELEDFILAALQTAPT